MKNQISLPYDSSQEALAALSPLMTKGSIGRFIHLSQDQTTQNLLVTIDKMGQSTLEFEFFPGPPWCWVLKKEKIAFTHKPFRKEAISEIQRMVEKLHGQCNL